MWGKWARRASRVIESEIDHENSFVFTQDLVKKIEFLLETGVQSCWLVQPPLRTVTLFPGTMDGTAVSSGSFTDPVLDIEVSVDAIFDPDE